MLKVTVEKELETGQVTRLVWLERGKESSEEGTEVFEDL